MSRSLVFVIACIAPWLAAAASANPAALTPYSATYTAKYNGLNLKAVRTLTSLGGQRYRIATKASHFIGRINELSEFTIQANDYIRPDYYETSRSIFGIKKAESTSFDWQTNIATYQSKGEKKKIELVGNDLDWLGYQVQLSIDMQAGKKEFNYHIVRRGRSKDYRFVITGEEVVDTPMGKIDAIKLLQIRENNKRRTELWVAPKLEYLLVKLRQTEDDGDQYELFLKNVKIKSTEVKIS